MQIELELLAPAKNKDIGIAAINCGADAVYMAADKFGAREAAANTIADIKELAYYAHTYNAKVFVTLNTILFDSEIKEASNLINKIYEAGADALIIQDLGITRLKNLPPIPLHASTQCNIRTVEQAEFLSSLGFDRLILARELSLSQIKEIHEKTSVPLEFFVHGALCVSYSGQCYLSHYLTGRSANRGCCAQACRSDYNLEDSAGNILIKNNPLLSLKDYNLSNKIGDLAMAGVTSFKIEGRLKNISYVKNVVKYYREQIDRFIANNAQYKRASMGTIAGGFVPDPDKTFNRGYTKLFIDGERGSWKSDYGAKYMGELIGTLTKNMKTKNGISTFEYKQTNKSTSPIINGDGLCFLAPDGTIYGARANSCNGNIVNTGEPLTLKTGSYIFRNFNIAFEKKLKSDSTTRYIPVELSFKETEAGEYIVRGEFEAGEIIYRVTEPSMEAKNQEAAQNSIRSQLSKTAGVFNFTVKEVNCTKVPFFTASSLNRFRREIALMAGKIIADTVAERKREEAAERIKTNSTRKDNYSFDGKKISYLGNISNALSKKVYLSHGASSAEEAFELHRNGNEELMRTKYCLKYELGLCTKYKNNADNKYKIAADVIKYPLYLVNGNNRLKLAFDCEKCEMTIIG